MLYLDRAEAYNHTIKLQIIDPTADPDGWSWGRFKAAWASRVGLVPRLRQRYLRVPLGLNHPVWVETLRSTSTITCGGSAARRQARRSNFVS